MNSGSLLLLTSTIAVLLPLQGGELVQSTDAKNHVGKTATICGRIVTYDCRESDKTTFLDLDRPYWEKGVAVSIAAADRQRIGLELEDSYLQREVCATGPVEKRNGRYLVSVREVSQIRVERQPTSQLADLPTGSARFCNGGVVKPTVVRLERPRYTRAAFDAKVEGKVFLDAIVLADGGVGAVRVVYSEFDPALGLEQQAIGAVKASRFKAGTVDGRPAPILVTLELMFVLR